MAIRCRACHRIPTALGTTAEGCCDGFESPRSFLRGLEKLTGEAELEFEEVSDDRFDRADGVKILLSDLEKVFGEREIFRQGGEIREFESVGRMQRVDQRFHSQVQIAGAEAFGQQDPGVSRAGSSHQASGWTEA